MSYRESLAACFLAAAVMTGQGCSRVQEQGIADKSAVAAAQYRADTIKIVDFLEDAYVIDHHSMSIKDMSAEQRALTLRFIDLRRRGYQALATSLEIEGHLRFMPLADNPLQDQSVDERVSRHDYLAGVAELNARADIVLSRMVAAIDPVAQHMKQKHADILISCRGLVLQRNIEPQFTPDNFHGDELKSYYDDIRPAIMAELMERYAAPFQIQEDELKFAFHRFRFSDIQKFTTEIDTFEQAVIAYENAVVALKDDIRPISAAVEARFLQIGHKAILMDHNIGLCNFVLDQMESRQGVFSDLPLPEQPPSPEEHPLRRAGADRRMFLS